MDRILAGKSARFLGKNAEIPIVSGFPFKKTPGEPGAVWRINAVRAMAVCAAVCFFLWFGWAVSASGDDSPNWLDYETALQKGKSAKRPLLIFFSTPWCYQCKEMKRKVFKNPDVVATLNEQFLLVEVDISERKRLKEEFHINYAPTSVFLDIHGKPIIDVKGYIPTGRFRKLLRFVAEGHYRTLSFPEFEKK